MLLKIHVILLPKTQAAAEPLRALRRQASEGQEGHQENLDNAS
jgi:hypothetical protein